jgi:hypothetical protein
MGMQELRAGIERIRASRQGDFTGPIPEEVLEDAEHLLGLRFPPTYRRFLHELGCGDVAGAEFYGIVDDELRKGPIPNAIWLTLDERATSRLPEQMVLVGFTGDMAGYYAIDLSRADGDGEAPVVMWQAGAPPATCPVIAKDFGVFLQEEVIEVLPQRGRRRGKDDAGNDDVGDV